MEPGKSSRARSPIRVSSCGTRVSRVASGGQANRTGAYGDVPEAGGDVQPGRAAALRPGRQPLGLPAGQVAVGHQGAEAAARRAARRGCGRPAPASKPSAAIASSTRRYGAWVTPSDEVGRGVGRARPPRRTGRARMCGSSVPTSSISRWSTLSRARALSRSSQPAASEPVAQVLGGQPPLAQPDLAVGQQVAGRVLEHRRVVVVGAHHEGAGPLEQRPERVEHRRHGVAGAPGCRRCR